MKIVILDGLSLNPGDLSWQGFEALGACEIYGSTPPELVVSRIGGAEIAIVNKIAMTREVFAACPALRYVGELATGYNNIDLAAATEHGVCVTNVPAYSTRSVAQMVFALLLEICHHTGHHSEAVRRGKWEESTSFCFWDYPLVELWGKTMGIVGYGRIGKQVAAIAEAFGMRVLAAGGRDASESLETVLKEADVLSLHCPLTKENTGMINRETIASMKDGAILINTARGALVVESDLRDALVSGKLLGAGLDVVSVEPMRADNPLKSAPNCVITPHIAWAPTAARARLMDIAAANLKAFLTGGEQNRVNRAL